MMSFIQNQRRQGRKGGGRFFPPSSLPHCPQSTVTLPPSRGWTPIGPDSHPVGWEWRQGGRIWPISGQFSLCPTVTNDNLLRYRDYCNLSAFWPSVISLSPPHFCSQLCCQHHLLLSPLRPCGPSLHVAPLASGALP